MKLITRRGERFEYLEQEDKLDLFSVTQIRKVADDAYANVPAHVLEPARVRGSALHRRFFFAMASRRGLCAYPPVLEQYEGYCRSMDRWIEKRQPTALELEAPGMSRRYRYAGTKDALLLLTDRKRDRRTIFDLKTGQPTKTDAMQLVAYDHMDDGKAEDLLDLYLDADGGEAVEAFVPTGKRAVEWAAFLSALNLLKWRISQ